MKEIEVLKNEFSIIQASYKDSDAEMFQLRSTSELAWYFIDGYADGIWLNDTFTGIEGINIFGILVSSTLFTNKNFSLELS